MNNNGGFEFSNNCFVKIKMPVDSSNDNQIVFFISQRFKNLTIIREENIFTVNVDDFKNFFREIKINR